MPMAPQSIDSQLWERDRKQMSLEFGLKCSQALLMADSFKFLPQ